MSTANYSLGSVSTPGPYAAPVAPGAVDGTVDLPGSKSLTARELVLSALADGASVLHRPLHSDDSARMITSLRALGVEIEEVEGDGMFGPDLRITPPARFTPGTIDCGQAGTVMRFVTPATGLADGDCLITAAENALHRPMGGIIQGLREVGVDIADDGTWSLPFTVRGHGRILGGEASVDASASSQFVSGLLLSAARFDVGLHLRHVGEKLPSIPHIDMTIDTLARRGVKVERPAPGEWVVPPGTIRAREVEIEPDLSNAAPFLAAAAVTGGTVTISGWPARSTQPGIHLPEILQAFGVASARRGGSLTVTGPDRIRAVDLDLSAVSELTPTLVGLAVFADGPSTFRGIGHIRAHETDRIEALVTNLAAVGITAEPLDDGLRVVPGTPRAGTWRAFHDHRIATTGAVIGLRAEGVLVDDIGATSKTLPQFVDLWHRLLGDDSTP